MKSPISDKLKWAIYDWMGSISEDEIMRNETLMNHVKDLCQKLSKLGSVEPKVKRAWFSSKPFSAKGQCT